MVAGKLQPKINGLIGELIQSASLREQKVSLPTQTNRHAYKLVITDQAEAKIDVQKTLCRVLVYGSSALQQIEFKGGKILEKLAETLFENYLGATGKKNAAPCAGRRPLPRARPGRRLRPRAAALRPPLRHDRCLCAA